MDILDKRAYLLNRNLKVHRFQLTRLSNIHVCLSSRHFFFSSFFMSSIKTALSSWDALERVKRPHSKSQAVHYSRKTRGCSQTTFTRRGKGQLISKQNCRAITSPKKRTQDLCPGSLLLQGQYKRESIFLQKEDRLSFCINLEVVNLEVEIQRSFFGRSYGSTILFRD